MATKKKATAKAAAKPSRGKPLAPPPKKAAATRGKATAAQPPPSVDDALEEPLLDASGVFRAVTDVAIAQRGGDEDEIKRFPDPSMIIEFEAKGIRDDIEPGDSGSFDPESLLNDAQRAARRKRLAELASQKRR